MPISKLAKGEATRQRLIRVAIRVFGKNGFTNTSFQDVANASKMRQTSLFYHFPNKDALIDSVIKEVIQHSHEVVAAEARLEDNAIQRLVNHFYGTLKWALKYREEAEILVLLYYYACVDKKFSDFYKSILFTARRRILEILLAGERESLFVMKAGPERTAELLHDALLGGILNLGTTDPKGITAPSLKRRWISLILALTGCDGSR